MKKIKIIISIVLVLFIFSGCRVKTTLQGTTVTPSDKMEFIVNDGLNVYIALPLEKDTIKQKTSF